MPRYYFHIRTDQGALLRDEIGVDLPDVEAVRKEARRTAASFTADARLGGCSDYYYFEILNENGRERIIAPAFERLKPI